MTQIVELEALKAVRIVLVAPAGPLNVGSVARVMKNFGLSQLVLVAPQCEVLGAEALQMAVHADDILREAKLVDTIPEALVGCEVAIATTARNRGFDAPLQLPEIALPLLLQSVRQSAQIDDDTTSSELHSSELHSSESQRGNSALIFGAEDRGLSNTELTYAQYFTKIPTSDTYSALNLAQAVAVCCYELYRASEMGSSRNEGVSKYPQAVKESFPLQNSPPSGKQTESSRQSQATLDELEGYYQHLESVLLKVEYLYPHTATARMRKVRQLLHRTAPTSNEVALLRGMLRQVEWALSDSNKG
ncbi:MAG: RNA methyltransferase [Cyanobacteria bacterium J06629_19]